MKQVCVFASSSDTVAPVYVDAARRLGEGLAARSYTLVYGAGSVGLMGAVAGAVQKGGGQVAGVIPKKLADLDLTYSAVDELIVTETLSERKAMMEERADAFVALPGGLGTLEELLEVLTLKQLWYHEKPVVVLNVEGIYDGFVCLLDTLAREAFLHPTHLNLFHVSTTPEDALAFIAEHEPAEPHARWF